MNGQTEKTKDAARLRMNALLNCANTLDTKANVALVQHFRNFNENKDWRALGHKTAKAYIEHAVSQGYVSLTVGTMLSYWHVAKAADKFGVDRSTLEQIGLNKARLVFSAPKEHVPALLAEDLTKWKPSDLNDRVKALRGVRNVASISYSGLNPEDIAESDLLLAHLRAAYPKASAADFYRALLQSYKAAFNVKIAA